MLLRTRLFSRDPVKQNAPTAILNIQKISQAISRFHQHPGRGCHPLSPPSPPRADRDTTPLPNRANTSPGTNIPAKKIVPPRVTAKQARDQVGDSDTNRSDPCPRPLSARPRSRDLPICHAAPSRAVFVLIAFGLRPTYATISRRQKHADPHHRSHRLDRP